MSVKTHHEIENRVMSEDKGRYPPEKLGKQERK